MHKRILNAAGWVTLFSALIAMIVGHTGAYDLSWKINQISTYAATAPRQGWITASMFLICGTLVCISILVSRYKIVGDSDLAHLAPLFSGAVIAGLVTLAGFKETVRTIQMLKDAGFAAVRQQSFHDAGLLIFFNCAILLALLLGALIIAQAASAMERLFGSAIILLGVAAFPLMIAPWPQMLGIMDAGYGLKQRASLLSLWLALFLVQMTASKKVRQ